MAHSEQDGVLTGGDQSAFSSQARADLQRHAAHYRAKRDEPLNTQISKSWVDFVRALTPNVRWPE